MKFAYADPPYIGQSRKHYGGIEVNHKYLITYLTETFDCWALSCHVNSLKQILNLCPDKIRILSWVKPFATFKKNVNPTYSWEPIIIYNPRPRGMKKQFLHDHISLSPQMKSDIIGQKPKEFCYWLFECMGLDIGDSFEDVFPGSGAVLRYWNAWINDQTALFKFLDVEQKCFETIS